MARRVNLLERDRGVDAEFVVCLEGVEAMWFLRGMFGEEWEVRKLLIGRSFPMDELSSVSWF